jgi:micrococcal nuclease
MGRKEQIQAKRPDRAVRRHKRFLLSLIMMALISVVALDRAGLLLAPRDDVRRYGDLRAQVIRVVDGDTFIVDLPDTLKDTPSTRVRVWGIDAPEMARNGSPAARLAVEATQYARDILDGQTVLLTVEPDRLRGRWGRLLAHVELADGELFSEKMLRAGLARADARWPHRYLKEFEEAQRDAKQRRVGLWAK